MQRTLRIRESRGSDDRFFLVKDPLLIYVAHLYRTYFGPGSEIRQQNIGVVRIWCEGDTKLTE